jgi:hypothetical protein
MSAKKVRQFYSFCNIRHLWTIHILVCNNFVVLQFQDDEFSYDSMDTKMRCILDAAACYKFFTPTTVTNCRITQGPYGDVIKDNPSNPAPFCA